ncbi:tol-pal system protein YbgF [Reinekea sp.]|jgi:tol-pal system protein YbgF|uniref:tol-pal system protein YbgF n=1 Tax=Reinekea sp. TaxID=1970455 RepID=UPI002A7FABC1|nr:tol-pal system protein YbgF [Reinekea sp.]
MIKKSFIGAALLGGTFALSSPQLFADVPIVRSQADHVASSANAVPLARQSSTPAPDPALIESLVFQLQNVEGLVAEQRGIIEELSYQIQVMQQEQKERYVDLDKRIQRLQEQVKGVAVAPATAQPADKNLALTDEAVLAQYNAATALMQERKFDQSIAQLAVFAKQHPDHPLAPNAWYWIGEIYLVQRKAIDATSAFIRIAEDYPSHDKVPDSLYKLGVIAQQAADAETARQYFERVLSEYPNTQSAKLAKARLESN